MGIPKYFAIGACVLSVLLQPSAAMFLPQEFYDDLPANHLHDVKEKDLNNFSEHYHDSFYKDLDNMFGEDSMKPLPEFRSVDDIPDFGYERSENLDMGRRSPRMTYFDSQVDKFLENHSLNFDTSYETPDISSRPTLGYHQGTDNYFKSPELRNPIRKDYNNIHGIHQYYPYDEASHLSQNQAAQDRLEYLLPEGYGDSMEGGLTENSKSQGYSLDDENDEMDFEREYRKYHDGDNYFSMFDTNDPADNMGKLYDDWGDKFSFEDPISPAESVSGFDNIYDTNDDRLKYRVNEEHQATGGYLSLLDSRKSRPHLYRRMDNGPPGFRGIRRSLFHDFEELNQEAEGGPRRHLQDIELQNFNTPSTPELRINGYPDIIERHEELYSTPRNSMLVSPTSPPAVRRHELLGIRNRENEDNRYRDIMERYRNLERQSPNVLEDRNTELMTPPQHRRGDFQSPRTPTRPRALSRELYYRNDPYHTPMNTRRFLDLNSPATDQSTVTHMSPEIFRRNPSEIELSDLLMRSEEIDDEFSDENIF